MSAAIAAVSLASGRMRAGLTAYPDDPLALAAARARRLAPYVEDIERERDRLHADALAMIPDHHHEYDWSLP